MNTETIVIDHLNNLVRKCRHFSKTRRDNGQRTTLEDSLELIQGELEEIPHNELIELSKFCVGICVAVGPTKLLGLINDKTTKPKDNETRHTE